MLVYRVGSFLITVDTCNGASTQRNHLNNDFVSHDPMHVSVGSYQGTSDAINKHGSSGELTTLIVVRRKLIPFENPLSNL